MLYYNLPYVDYLMFFPTYVLKVMNCGCMKTSVHGYHIAAFCIYLFLQSIEAQSLIVESKSIYICTVIKLSL